MTVTVANATARMAPCTHVVSSVMTASTLLRPATEVSPTTARPIDNIIYVVLSDHLSPGLTIDLDGPILAPGTNKNTLAVHIQAQRIVGGLEPPLS